jgi:hypothetical protein
MEWLGEVRKSSRLGGQSGDQNIGECTRFVNYGSSQHDEHS